MTDSATLLGNEALEKVSVRPPRSSVLALMGLHLMVYRSRSSIIMLLYVVLVMVGSFWVGWNDLFFITTSVIAMVSGLQGFVGLSFNENVDRFYAMLPVGRVDVVNARWLEAGIYMMVALGLDIFFVAGVSGVGGGELRIIVSSLSVSVIALILAGPISVCLRGMVGIVTFFLSYCFANVLIWGVLNFDPVSDALHETYMGWWVLAVLVLVAVLVSWWLTRRIYEGREH